MRLFSNFKRHPPKVEEAYYAQLSESAIDVDFPMIEEAVEATAHLTETWPYASLSDLETFLSYIKQNYAIPTGEIISLGEIQFMMNNPKTNQPEETGLTWSPVDIGPTSDHFTVETVRNTLNDKETRLNDEITYTDISESLQQLLEAAQEYADTPLEELPELPTEDEYVDAVRENLPLTIEAMKYTTSAPDPVKDEIPSTTEAMPVFPSMESTPVNQSEATPDVFPNEETTVDLGIPEYSEPLVTEPKETSVVTTPEVEVDTAVEPTPQPSKQNLVSNMASGHFQAVDQFHIDMPLFEIDENLANKTLTPADEQYVLSELEKAKKESNRYLRLSAEKFESTIREKLMAIIDPSEFDAEKQKLLASDWQDTMKSKIAADISQRFVGQKEQANSQIERQFENDSLAEQERHERAMNTLKQQKDLEIQRSTDMWSEQERQAISTEQTHQIAEQEVYIKQLLTELENKFNDDVTAKLTEAMNHYRPAAIASLDAGYKQIKAQLAQTEEELTKKHKDAVAQNLELSKQKVAEHDVTKMQARISSLNNSELHLTEKSKDLLNKLDQSSKKEAKLTAEVEDLQKRLAIAESKNATDSQNKHSQMLENLLTAQAVQANNQWQQVAQHPVQEQSVQAPQPEKKKRSRGTIALVSLLSVLTLSGVGFGIYSYQNAEQVKQEQAAALQAAKAEAESKSKTQEDTKPEPEKDKTDDFKLLDESLSKGSLGVYKSKYEGKDLKTDDRTYNVGQLFLSQGLIDDAWAVASSNDGHNERLIALLKGEVAS